MAAITCVAVFVLIWQLCLVRQEEIALGKMEVLHEISMIQARLDDRLASRIRQKSKPMSERNTISLHFARAYRALSDRIYRLSWGSTTFRSCSRTAFAGR